MISNQKYKKLVAAGLSLSLMFGGTSAVSAAFVPPGLQKQMDKWEKNQNNKGPGKNNGKHNNGKNNKGNNKGKDNRYSEIKISFKDLEGLDWARKHIANLAAMHIFEGYDDGTFRPNKPVTRLEAVITAVRLMDLRDEAEAASDSHLNFKDANLIERKYPQAVGYVAVAAENDLFIETEDMLQPEKPATRLWVATMLIKAMGLEEEARAKMNDRLRFNDASEIPAGSVGYVALAVEKGIVFGYDDKTFKPNKPVTRAEIAAFLDRTGAHMPGFNENAYEGTLIGKVDDDELLLEVDGKLIELPIDADAFIFRDGKETAASQLRSGDYLRVRTYNGTVIFIDVIDFWDGDWNNDRDDDKDDNKDDDNDETAAFAAEVVRVDDDDEITLTIDGKRKTYDLDDDVLVRRWDGTEGKLSHLNKGDRVFVRVEDGDVTFIHILEYRLFDTSGTLIALPSDGKIIINTKDGVKTYSLSDDIEIIRDNAKVTPQALIIQDELDIRIEDDEIVKIEVKEAADIHASFTAVMAAAISDGKITLQTEDHTLQYRLADNVAVIRQDKHSSEGELRVGDEMKVQVINNQVISIEVTKASNANISFEATVKSKVDDDEIVLEKDGLTHRYELADNVQIFRNGKIADTDDLKAGDKAIVMVVDSKVVLITVTK